MWPAATDALPLAALRLALLSLGWPSHRASQRHLLAVPRCSEARRYVVGHSAAAVARFLGRIESKPLWDVSYECGSVIHVSAAVWPSRIDR